MKRAWLSLAAFFGLVLIAARANGVCPITTTVNNNLPDTVKVGYGGTLALDWSFTAPELPVDSCRIITGQWANLTDATTISASVVNHPATLDSNYTATWRPPDPGTFRMAPYLTDSLGQVIYSLDTTVVIVKEGLWYPDAFHYRGAFLVPRRDGVNSGDADFGGDGTGSMLAYCPTGEAGDSDGYGGSLYMNGKMHGADGNNVGGWIAQVTIPTPVIDPLGDMDNLPQAAFIQNFADAFDSPNTNWRTYPGNIPKPGDLLYVPAEGGLTYDALYFTYRDTYATDVDYYALGRVPADLADKRPQGLWHLGAWNVPTSLPWSTNHRSWADWMFAAPRTWVSANLGNNQWVIAGMGDREAGTNGASRGPTMFAFDPSFADRGGTSPTGSAGGDTSKIPVTRLLQYAPEALENTCQPLGSTHNVSNYSRTDSWSDGAWLTHNNRQAVIFTGSKCLYASHYGSDGCVGSDQGPCNEVTGWVCGEDSDAAPGYRVQMWFYDPDEFVDVIRGDKELWEPQPMYGYLDLTPYVFYNTDCQNSVAGVAYDDDAGRLYIAQRGDTTQSSSGITGPIIHVFDITPWESYVVSMGIQSEGYAHVGDSLQVIFDWDLQTTADCTFATDTTSVSSISIVVADSVYVTDTAPLGLPPFETKVYLATDTPPTVEIKGRINIDASGTDCDGQFDSNVRSVYVAP